LISLTPSGSWRRKEDAFAVFLFVVEWLEVITGNDVMIAAFAASGFEHAQNSLDTRRRFRRNLDVERFVVLTEYKLLIAVRGCDAAETEAQAGRL